ncbi:hypothetical protein [Chachezhania antarctica]|uniref:hypothetical protein n=1 Tax=Chachezhania antarctica TaxID=2340860 RepID=UPI000EB4C5E7|nr:hypothetical protein [Chachezhania antarctica]|tara:strand:- start:1835 stop:2119 length:285 start_codon:yes stop_codon:yes gene_type:complete
MSLWYLSLVLAIADVASAVMLAAMVLRLRCALRLSLWTRGLIAMLAVCLCLHAVEQVNLLYNYRPPRAFTWIGVMLSMHGVIAACYWRTFVRLP